jgi:hypothetical protein
MDAVGFDAIEAMDAELARLSRGGAALRLWLGMGLERLARVGGHHELGYSSLEAYALDRCERATRWVQDPPPGTSQRRPAGLHASWKRFR